MKTLLPYRSRICKALSAAALLLPCAGILHGPTAHGQVWNPNPETDIAGYTIHLGTSHATLRPYRTVDKNSFSCVIAGLSPSTTYFSSVQAFNTSGVHGGMSPVVSFTTPMLSLSAAEIAVISPGGDELVNSTGILEFGDVLQENASSTQTITVINYGSEDLTGIDLFTDGMDAGDFMVSYPATSTLAPGMATTFEITFVPSATGNREATLHLLSNDNDEYHFLITLKGTGTPPNELMDSDGDGSSDAEEIANKTDPQSAASSLRILAFVKAPDFHHLTNPVFDVIFTTAPGLSYSLECSQSPDFRSIATRVSPYGVASGSIATARITLLTQRDFVRVRRDP